MKLEKLFKITNEVLTKRYKLFWISFLLAILVNSAWSYYVYLGSTNRQIEIATEEIEIANETIKELTPILEDANKRKIYFNFCKEDNKKGNFVRCDYHWKTRTDEKSSLNVPTASADGFVPSNRDKELMERICSLGKLPGKGVSPLCNDWNLYSELKTITIERLPDTWWPIMLGISYAESHIGVNFANDNQGGNCYGRNNWWGAKYAINDDNSRDYKSGKFGGYNTNYRFTDAYGCNLYPFESISDYWKSKVNGMRYGYKGCINSDKPITCLSYQYVGNPNVAEESWIQRVAIISK